MSKNDVGGRTRTRSPYPMVSLPHGRRACMVPRMKKDSDKSRDKKPAAAEPPKVPVIHDLSGRIPAMSDAELNALHANAQRLLASGSAAQKASASTLAPVIEAEVARREAAKAEAREARLSKRKKGPGGQTPPDEAPAAG